MGFYWAGFIFWTLMIAALLFLFYGVWKRSWQAFMFSGIAFLFPIRYFVGAENWFRLLGFVPLILFTLAYIAKKTNKD